MIMLPRWYFEIVISTLLALAAAVGLPQPFSMPPQPEDPALLRIVPPDAMLAFTWSGAAAADAQSSNATVRLCAEPEVRQAIAALQAAMAAMFGDGPDAAIARQTLTFVAAALQQPGCLFVRSLRHAGQLRIDGGLAIHLGNQMPMARALLSVLSVPLRARLHDATPPEDFEVDDQRFRVLPTDAEGQCFCWAEADGWLLFAAGAANAQPMLRGLRGRDEGLAGTEAVRRLRTATAVAQPATRTFVQFERLLAELQATEGSRAREFAAALGIDRGGAAMATTGLDGDGFASIVQVDLPTRTGLLAALTGAPIQQDTLVAVPADADVAIVLRADPEAVEAALLALVNAVTGEPVGDAYEEFQREFAAEFGIAWRRDLLLRLDGNLALWNAPSQGGIAFTAATMSAGLRDGGAFADAWQRLMNRIGENLPSKAARRAAAAGERMGRHETFLESFAHEGRTVHWLDVPTDGFPFAPAFAACPSAFVAGLAPESVRSAIEAIAAPNPDRSLARWPALNRRGAATVLWQFDAATLLPRAWPLLTMLLQQGTREWQRDGFDFDLADLPRLSTLAPHLGREIARLEPLPTGVAWRRTGTLPVFDPLLLVGAGMVAAVTSR